MDGFPTQVFHDFKPALQSSEAFRHWDLKRCSRKDVAFGVNAFNVNALLFQKDLGKVYGD